MLSGIFTDGIPVFLNFLDVIFHNGTGRRTKNRGPFVQWNTILTYEKAFNFFFYDHATLADVTYVSKFLEKHSPNNVTNNFNSTLSSQNCVL